MGMAMIEQYSEEELVDFYWYVIDEERKKKRMTWEMLAQETNLLRNTISIAKNSCRTLDFEETVKISNALEMDINILCKHFFYPSSEYYEVQGISFEKDDSISIRFWKVVDVIRKQERKSWDDIANEASIKRSTISSAKSYGRSLPFYKHCFISEALNFSIGSIVSIITDHKIEDLSLSAKLKCLSQEHLQMINSMVDIMLKAEKKEQKNPLE